MPPGIRGTLHAQRFIRHGRMPLASLFMLFVLLLLCKEAGAKLHLQLPGFVTATNAAELPYHHISLSLQARLEKHTLAPNKCLLTV